MNEHRTDTLTPREHEVLQGVLDHKTAKEMAIELGVSHHAVEKRLKRARQKLGATTSLEAARLYRAKYGQTVSGPTDLHEDTAAMPSRSYRERTIRVAFIVGAIAMLTIAAFFMLSADPEIDARVFAMQDKNESGYIERAEFLADRSAVTTIRANSGGDSQVLENDSAAADAAIARAFNQLDTNKDGRLSKEEYGRANRTVRRISVTRD